jgi:hypothetical protein
MSHPGAISCRCNLTISRRRRRIRLRRTALPSAFFMLQPKRLLARPLGRRNSVNSRLLRRRPSRYTASYSARRTRRKARGKSSRVATSDAREAVAPFFAASCKNFPSTLGFHALAKPVLFMAAPHMRLKSAFRQRSLSLTIYCGSRTATNRASSRNKQFRRPAGDGQGTAWNGHSGAPGFRDP